MSESPPYWQHHGLVTATTQDDERVQGCTCQFMHEDVEFVDGKVNHLGEKDDDCPHRKQKVRVDGRKVGRSYQSRQSQHERGL